MIYRIFLKRFNFKFNVELIGLILSFFINKENVTFSDCRNLITKYEPNEEYKKQNKLTLYGFISYLNDHDQYIDNPAMCDKVYQDMNLPFSHYFINSSHNTYLRGDQLTSESKAESYINAIMMGSRLVESSPTSFLFCCFCKKRINVVVIFLVDLYDGSDGQPKIYHKSTLTSKLNFEDALIAIKEYAFKLTE